jgi:hypothetical protein
LSHSVSVLQDDSGIPVRFFAQGWQLHPYGRYVGPISLFGGQYQAKLNDVFAKGHATPIDFSLGYRWKPMESNIMLAVKDPTATAFEIAPPAAGKKSPSEAEADSVSKPKREAKADLPARRIYRRHREQTVSNPWPKLFGYAP